MMRKILIQTSYLSQINQRRALVYSFLTTKLTEDKLDQLKLLYIKNPSLNLFQTYVETPSDYFKIFATIYTTPYYGPAYHQLQEIVSQITPQTDNVILLRAKIFSTIAENCQKQKQYIESRKFYEKALDCIETSMVPQILQYYGLYRKYGMFLAQIKDPQAKDVLKQSVIIIQQFVNHSDDPVSSSLNSLKQAQAATKLFKLDLEDDQKWLNLAMTEWKNCSEQKYKLRQYAQAVLESSRRKIESNPKDRNKVKLYADVEMQKMEDLSELQDILSEIQKL